MTWRRCETASTRTSFARHFKRAKPAPQPAVSATLQYAAGVLGDEKGTMEEFLTNVETNTKQYLKLFSEAADACMPQPTRTDLPDDVYDVLLQQVRTCREFCAPCAWC